MLTNFSAYAKFAEQYVHATYLCKIVVFRTSVSDGQSQICKAQLLYINGSDMQMYWHILCMQKHL